MPSNFFPMSDDASSLVFRSDEHICLAICHFFYPLCMENVKRNFFSVIEFIGCLLLIAACVFAFAFMPAIFLVFADGVLPHGRFRYFSRFRRPEIQF
ncbi:MAG: hypothetical protein LBQ81_02380 [Zoogloeaceae bacterium]|nr:hypothetical protein [Zoogloeaceae bacterium]